MRFQLSAFTAPDDRTGDVCEVAGSNIVHIPDLEVVKILLTFKRLKAARSMGASAEELSSIAASYRPYTLESPVDYTLYYDDSDFDCNCSTATMFIEEDRYPLDGEDPFYVKLEFDVDYCGILYDDDGEATNLGEYDDTEYINMDITEGLSKLGKDFVTNGLRGSSAMVFKVTRHECFANNCAEVAAT